MAIVVKTDQPSVTKKICRGMTFRGRKKRHYGKDANGLCYFLEVVR
jgi:hypothetical protein